MCDIWPKISTLVALISKWSSIPEIYSVNQKRQPFYFEIAPQKLIDL